MKAKKKKWLAAALAAIMAFTMTPMMAFAQTENDGYVEWDGTTPFPTSGKVRVTADVITFNFNTSERNDNFKGPITIDGELTIDLNGHTLEIYSFNSPNSQIIVT